MDYQNYDDDEIIPMPAEENADATQTQEGELSFADLGLDEKTLAAIERKGFKVPSPIQQLAIPRLLNGESNMIARARTGTGKTAAFGLPIIQSLRDSMGNVRALILEPTRELAIQTCTELQSFTEGKVPRTCVLYGGASYSTQIKDLKRGCEIVVGTPGRIQDHLERGTLNISNIDYFILDEGDEMLDMGFVDDIEAIFQQANPNARILLFSATMPEPILKIAQKFMGDYEIVEEENVIDEPLLIEQKVWVLRDNEKVDALVRLIDISPDFYGVVFTQTKNDADYVARSLDERGFEAAALHGDIAQNQREKILARFRSKKTRILVATDVAARGIDISGLSHVVNYSLPFDGATYVHRIGRTGRAGSEGTAVTFVCPNELRKLSFLQRAIRKASKGEMKEEKIPSVEEVIEKKRKRLFDELKEKIGLSNPDEASASTTEEMENAAQNENQSAHNMRLQEESQNSTGNFESSPAQETAAEPAENNATENSSENLSEQNEEKPASTLKRASEQFHQLAAELCKNDQAEDVLAAVLSVLYGDKLNKSRYGKISSANGGNSANQTRLFIQLGRRDGYNARAIADYFSELLHIPGKLVDRIDVASNFSLLSLPKDAARKALDMAKNNGRVPHMHIDSKEGGRSNDFGKRRRGSEGKGRRGEGSGEGGFSRSRESRRFGEKSARERFGIAKDSRDFSKGKNRSFEGAAAYKSKSRPNVHTPTERNGASAYKKSTKAERF